MNYRNVILVAAIFMIAILAVPAVSASPITHINKYNPNVGSLWDMKNAVEGTGGFVVFRSHAVAQQDPYVFIHNDIVKNTTPLDMIFHFDLSGGEPALNQSGYKAILVQPNGESIPEFLTSGSFSYTVRRGNGDNMETGSFTINTGGFTTYVVYNGDAKPMAGRHR